MDDDDEYSAVATCLGAVCGVLILFLFWFSHFSGCLETGDYASNALGVELATQFQAVVGPYSRLGFYHPGPVLFYWRALFHLLFEPLLADIVATIVLNSIALAVVAKALRTHLHLLLFVVTLSLLVPRVWLDTWGPYAVVLPLAGAVSIARSSLVRSRWAGLLAIFLATVALQTHVLTAVLVVPLYVYLLWRGSPSDRLWRGGLLVILWFLPILELFQPAGGNLLDLLGTLLSFEQSSQFYIYLVVPFTGGLLVLLLAQLPLIGRGQWIVVISPLIAAAVVAQCDLRLFAEQCSGQLAIDAQQLQSIGASDSPVRIRPSTGDFYSTWPAALAIGLELSRQQRLVCFGGRYKRVTPKALHCSSSQGVPQLFLASELIVARGDSLPRKRSGVCAGVRELSLDMPLVLSSTSNPTSVTVYAECSSAYTRQPYG